MVLYAAAVGVKDLTPVLEIYLREQFVEALEKLKGTEAENLLTAWFQKQTVRAVLSVEVSKLLP